MNLMNDLKVKNETILRGIPVAEVKTGINKQLRKKAIMKAVNVMANDSQRNCPIRFKLVAPATFLKPASFPLFVYRAVARFI